MKKFIKIFLIALVLLLVAIAAYFLVGQAPQQKNITWGVDFSQMQAEALKLDWKKTYLAILDDLGAKHIKLHTQWDWVEGVAPRNKSGTNAEQRGNEVYTYYFDDIDWQIQQAQKHNASIIYVVGMKTGRWPECHTPNWANSLSKQEQQDELLKYVSTVVGHYKDSKAIVAWQAENEPLFEFGKCPLPDKEFLKREVALIKSLDPSRPVIISDSGEQSFWFQAAQVGDIVGTTMYRKVWTHITDQIGFYSSFPIPPVFYWRKAQLVKYFFNKAVICVELQAEPWTQGFFYDTSLSEQEKTMNLEQFKENILYAKKTGLDTFYLWGTEWWYWLKTQQGKSQIWDEAKKLF